MAVPVGAIQPIGGGQLLMTIYVMVQNNNLHFVPTPIIFLPGELISVPAPDALACRINIWKDQYGNITWSADGCVTLVTLITSTLPFPTAANVPALASWPNGANTAPVQLFGNTANGAGITSDQVVIVKTAGLGDDLIYVTCNNLAAPLHQGQAIQITDDNGNVGDYGISEISIMNATAQVGGNSQPVIGLTLSIPLGGFVTQHLVVTLL